MSPGARTKRAIEGEASGSEDGEENLEAKRRRVLEETMDIDADSDGGSESGSSEEESDDEEEDETAELLRELEKIKRERAEAREREVCIIPQFNFREHLSKTPPKNTRKQRKLPKSKPRMNTTSLAVTLFSTGDLETFK